MVELGSGQFIYEVAEGWGTLPDGWGFKEVAAVGADAKGNVYAFNRGDHPMIVFDKDGNFFLTHQTMNFFKCLNIITDIYH